MKIDLTAVAAVIPLTALIFAASSAFAQQGSAWLQLEEVLVRARRRTAGQDGYEHAQPDECARFRAGLLPDQQGAADLQRMADGGQACRRLSGRSSLSIRRRRRSSTRISGDRLFPVIA